ncbi:MAG TPA: thioesterase family protein [Methylomirabilota bacterium]|nr:thioesterase family protein [Methylomirabilota bacterium]
MTRPPAIPLPSGIESDPAVAWTVDTLRYADADANGHVNNTTYAVLAESGRVRLVDTAMASAMPAGSLFVVGRLTIEFRAELFFPGRVRTATWVARIGGTSLILHQALFGDDGLAATADAVCVLIDGATRRPLPLPDGMRIAAAAYRPATVAVAEGSEGS